jgi:TonB family protein
MIVMLLAGSDRIAKFLPHRQVVFVSPADMAKQKDLTFLELPPDEQKVSKRPDTDVISDKDRIATSKRPQVDPKELKKILDAARAGARGKPGNACTTAAGAGPTGSAKSDRTATRSATTSAIAARATCQSKRPGRASSYPKADPATYVWWIHVCIFCCRGGRQGGGRQSWGYGGEGGDFGTNLGQSGAKTVGQLDVLSDTMGVDFGPYLSRVVQNVRANWYNIIPEVARPPIMKKGKLSIEFAILKDGKVAGMKLATGSGDVALDRAAWGGITASNPFPPLPQEFGGQYLYLRFNFFYNPDSADLK